MNILILIYITNTLIAILATVFWVRALLKKQPRKMYIACAVVSMLIAAPAGILGGLQNRDAKDRATYKAWIKHTSNPSGLSFDEWRLLNRNYVPSGKNPRNIQPETN